MNTDDYYATNDAIERLVTALEKNNAEVSYGIANFLNEKDEITFIFHPKLKAFTYQMPCCHNTILAKKMLFTQFSLFDESYKTAADYKWIYQILLSKTVAYGSLNAPLVCFRRTGAGTDEERTWKEIARIFKEYYCSAELNDDDYYTLAQNKVSIKICYGALRTQNKHIRTELLKNIILPLVFKHSSRLIVKAVRFRFITFPIESLYKKIKSIAKQM